MRDDERLTLTLHSESDTDALGRALANVAVPDLVMGFIGPLGAGKTRLTRAFAEAMGVDPDAIASPTFVLIHEYHGRLPIYHFDAYRLDDPEAFDALGASEYFVAGGVCIVEWADLVLDRLPTDAWLVRITPTAPTARSVVIEGPDLSPLRSILERVLPGR
jgi:tRNA threonylcarbamoyladenosine biosynthesis protein TsaE